MAGRSSAKRVTDGSCTGRTKVARLSLSVSNRDHRVSIHLEGENIDVDETIERVKMQAFALCQAVPVMGQAPQPEKAKRTEGMDVH